MIDCDGAVAKPFWIVSVRVRLVLMDAVLRKLPGALGHEESAVEESFSQALGGDPEYPHYTRPAEYRGWNVPSVLLSGHHAEIQTWRRARSHERGVVGPTARPPDPAEQPESSGADPFGPMGQADAPAQGPDPFA